MDLENLDVVVVFSSGLVVGHQECRLVARIVEEKLKCVVLYLLPIVYEGADGQSVVA